MLSQEQLVQLHGNAGDQRVLSVYIDAREEDPAARREWRLRLRNMFEPIVTGAVPDERVGLSRAFDRVERELRSYPGQLPGPGWIAFSTPDRLLYAGPTPAPVPDLVRWEPGLQIAPYVRSLKQSRDVIVVLADQVHARVFRYRLGHLEEEETLHASASAHRGEFGSWTKITPSSGPRGGTRTDAAQRMKEASTQRLVREIARTVLASEEDTRQESLLAIGGNAEIAAAVLEHIPDSWRARAIEVTELHVDAPDTDVRSAVEAAASVLSERLQLEIADRVIDLALSNGHGCLGAEHVERALAAGAVDTLAISSHFSNSEPDRANQLLLLTLDQGGRIEELSGSAADKIDGHGEVGARLRFAV